MVARTDRRRCRRGLPLTTGSDLAADHYSRGIDELCTEGSDAAVELSRAVAADRSFAVAHAGLAIVALMTGDRAAARANAATARELGGAATDRERGHIAIAGLLAAGSIATAREAIAAHLASHPRDVLILFVAAWLDGGGGQPEGWLRVRDLLSRHRDALGEDSYFLGAWAFAHAETGDLSRAGELASRALEIDPGNANAVHCMAHVLSARRELTAAIALVESWLVPERSPLRRTHLCWHLATAALAAGDADRAAEVYHDLILPAVLAQWSPFALVDAAQLLWRSQLAGFDPGDEWEPVADLARALGPAHATPMVALHAALALGLAGDDVAIADVVDSLALTTDDDGAAPVAIRLVDGMLAHHRRDHRRAVELLTPEMAHVDRLGATREQRGIVAATLTASRAALRSGGGG